MKRAREEEQSGERTTTDFLSKGGHLLAHPQLHEVLYSWLPTDGVFDLRSVHSAAASTVLAFAETCVMNVTRFTSPAMVHAEETEEERSRRPSVFVGYLWLLSKELSPDQWRGLASEVRFVDVYAFTPRWMGDKSQSRITSLLLKDPQNVEFFRAPLLKSNAKAIQRLIDGAASSALKSFTISSSMTSQDTELTKALCAACKVLENVCFHCCFHITDDDLEPIWRQCPDLKDVDISWTGREKITDVTLLRMAQNCKYLRRISVNKSPGITPGGIARLVEACPHIESLDIGGHFGAVADPTLFVIQKHCRRLKTLSVAHSGRGISDSGIDEITANCPLLESLNVCGARGGITDASIHRLRMRCPHLSYLNVSMTCGKITAQCLSEFPSAVTIIDVARESDSGY